MEFVKFDQVKQGIISINPKLVTCFEECTKKYGRPTCYIYLISTGTEKLRSRVYGTMTEVGSSLKNNRDLA